VDHEVNSTENRTERDFEMNIRHNPIFDTEKVATIYAKKDGVPVRYVCTSAPNQHASYAADIFYRLSPHPEFGNRYFGLYYNQTMGQAEVMITNADMIEDLTFEMIEVDGEFHYSQHRHDYRDIGGGIAIDGGRAYYRSSFTDREFYMNCQRKTLKVRDGEFVDAEN
jgi:hypothetical protein